jgi:ABC-type uncharacterized transport system substrate-binding protein
LLELARPLSSGASRRGGSSALDPNAIRTAATSFAIEAVVTPAHHKDEIEVVIAERRGLGGAIIVIPDTFNTTNRELIIGLAARYGVPAIYFNRYFAVSGGLIAYGAGYVELFRQTAGYVDQILHGAHPGELPIQLPATCISQSTLGQQMHWVSKYRKR